MIDIKGSRVNKIDLWVYRPDYTYLGITTHTVECPECHHRMTFNGDIPPKNCYLCNKQNYGVANNEKTN